MSEGDELDLPVNQAMSGSAPSSSSESEPKSSPKNLLPKSEWPTVKQRIDKAESYVKKEVLKPMKRGLELFLGNHFPGRKSQGAQTVVNTVLHIVETIVAANAFNYPEFDCVATSPMGEGQEDLVRSAISTEWKEAHVQREAKRTFKDTVIYGAGVCLYDWKTRTKKGDGYDELSEDRFLAKRLNPSQFGLSPECGRVLEDAEYVVWWEFLPLEKVRENQKNAGWKYTQDLKGSSTNLKDYLSKAVRDLTEEQKPDDIKRVKIYHYYEYEDRIHAIFCGEHDKCLFVEAWPDWWECYPFAYMQGPGDEDTFYGMSIPLLLEHIQGEENEWHIQLSNYLRMFIPRYQTAGSIRPEQEEALGDFSPGAVVQGLEEPLTLLPLPPVPEFLITTMQTNQKDAERQSAVDQYQLGNPPSKRTPELEVQAIQSVGGARAQATQQMFEMFSGVLANACYDAIKANKAGMINGRPNVLTVRDAYGKKLGYHEDFSGASLLGDHHIEVYVNSTTAPNAQTTLKEVGYFTQAIMPLLQIGPGARPLARQILAQLPDIRNKEEVLDALFPPPAPPPPPGLPPPGAPGLPAEAPPPPPPSSSPEEQLPTGFQPGTAVDIGGPGGTISLPGGMNQGANLGNYMSALMSASRDIRHK